MSKSPMQPLEVGISPSPSPTPASPPPKEKEFEVLKSTLGPVIFQLALEQDTIKELFALLKKLFGVFDENSNGEISKEELHVLVQYELLDKAGAQRLRSFSTVKTGVVDFAEFAAFFASEFLLNVPVSSEQKVSDPTKTSAKGKSAADLEAVPLPSKWQASLPPIIFRLMCRENELRRIFSLFKKMFDIFDENHDSKIEMRELARLLEADFIDQTAYLALQHAAGGPAGSLTFPQFLSFWIGHYLETAPMSKEEENVLNSALGPIVFKLAMEQTTIKELFDLLHKLFDVFDVNHSGDIDKKEIQTLLDCDLMDERALKRLMKWDTNRDNQISFVEFCAFIAAEMLRSSVELLDRKESAPASSPKPLPPQWDKSLPPLLFRLASRKDDMVRIFTLFRKMFDIFDTNKNAKIDKKELRKLVQLEILSAADLDALMKWKTKHRDSVVFNEFIAFWIATAVQDPNISTEQKLDKTVVSAPKAAPAASASASGDAKSAASTSAAANTAAAKQKKDLTARIVGVGADGKASAVSKADKTKVIAPLLLRLASERDSIKKSFDLLGSLFRALDDNGDGFIDKTEIAGLIKDQLLDQESVKKLDTFDTDRNGKISFNEFLAFLADELVSTQGKF